VDHQHLDISPEFGHIRDHVRWFIGGGQVEWGSPAWLSLKEILQEVQRGMIYRRRRRSGRATQ